MKQSKELMRVAIANVEETRAFWQKSVDDSMAALRYQINQQLTAKNIFDGSMDGQINEVKRRYARLATCDEILSNMRSVLAQMEAE